MTFGSVLIVDDSAVDRAHSAALCRDLGIEAVRSAASGEEALALIEAACPLPDFLIIDLEMPLMDGVQLIQQLNRRALYCPLVVASGREGPLIQSVEAMASSLGFPVVVGLQKPVSRSVLKGALERLGKVTKIGGAARRQCADDGDPDASELANAIARDEIGVHFQPKVDMRTGIVRGVEALARWNLKGRGAIAPDRFVRIAECEGLIHALTLRVMATAFAQVATWNSRGWRLTVAVNLSPKLLDRPSLAEEILALAGRYRVRPEQIIFELTETSLVQYLGIALGVLTRLRLKGFGISIDDYGTGFSSMQQLARIPFTELKVDRSFVQGARHSTKQQVIVRSALDLAHCLGLKTVAEGIETLEDWRLLQDYGCDIGQGYLIGMPMAAADFPKWSASHLAAIQDLKPKSKALE